MNPDDPKLTAYALDELDPAERAEVEQLLRENPGALAEVEETERLAAQLRRELHAEPAAPLTAEQRAELLAVAGDNDPGSASTVSRLPPLDHASQAEVADPGYSRRWWRPLALAAGVAVLAGGAAVVLQWAPSGDRIPPSLAQLESSPQAMSPAPAATPTALAFGPSTPIDLGEIEGREENEKMLLAARGDIPAVIVRSNPVPTEPLSVAEPLPTLALQSAAVPDAPTSLGRATAHPAASGATAGLPGEAEVAEGAAPAPELAPAAGPAVKGEQAAVVGGDGLAIRDEGLLRSVAPAQPAKPAAPVASTMSTAGTSPVTAGNRSGSLATSQNAIDVLLFGMPGTDPLAAAATDEAAKAPAVQALSGVFSDPQYELTVRALDPKKAAAGKAAPTDRFAGAKEVQDQLQDVKEGVDELRKLDRELATSGLSDEAKAEKSALRAEKGKALLAMDARTRTLLARSEKQLQERPTSPVSATPAPNAGAFHFPDGSIAGVPGVVTKSEVQWGDNAGKPVTELVEEVRRQREPSNTETYDAITDNAFLAVREQPLSTFSIDVDTASYANVRRFLNEQRLPPRGAVRIEELLNYFDYDYPQPEGEAPFSATMEVAACPWTPEHRLVRIGLKGRTIDRDRRPASNLVFLVDVSGSMQPENKLPLVKKCLRQLVDHLGAEDTVAIAVYAGASGCVLEPTNKKSEIRAAIEKLESGGSTNGAAGIQLAYQLAERNFIKGGANRVILATDGDFNVGVTSQSELTRLIEKKAKSGVFLTVLGFGMGNLKDSTLEKLADKGNGNYAYIDTFNEARKVLVEQMSGTLVTIAKDVKIQVEFNPAQVSGYRLIGYENRLLKKEDFNDDTKDAGEIGAGHTVTALYEVVPAEVKTAGAPRVDPLKYQASVAAEKSEIRNQKSEISPELLTLKLRYKAPDGETSKLLEFPLTDDGKSYERSSRDFRFAAAVASFGMLLRDSPHKGNANWSSTLELAIEGKGEDRSGYRAEFVSLVERAKAASR